MHSSLLQSCPAWLGSCLLVSVLGWSAAQAQTQPLLQGRFDAPPAPASVSSGSTQANPSPTPAPQRPTVANVDLTQAATPAPPAPAPSSAVVRQVEAAPSRAPAQQAVAAKPASPITEGHAVKQALAMQASGRHAGPPRPMMGLTAPVSLKRYVDSFKHPIPEFYQSETEHR